jgi:signal transduction histidine kinase
MPAHTHNGTSGAEPVARILLVDDEARNLDALESILTSPDYELVRAQSAEAALLALVRTEFACIVLDVLMPETDGFELALLIKTRKRNQHIPIIFLTAYLQDEKEILRGYGAGAVDYLTKPLNPEVLKSKVGVFVDLFKATRALAAANNALELEIRQRKELEKLVLTISEREQQRIGQDLHDGLCQHLTGIRFKCRLLGQKLDQYRVPEEQDLREIESLLALAVEQARNQAHGLSPLRLEKEGLVAAFHELAAGVSSVFAIDCRCASEGPVSISDLEVAVHLYRIAQEAISNAIRHGGAKVVNLRVAEASDHLHLSVEDDGRGFANGSPQSQSKGMGLAIMNYRARTIGAALTIESDPGGGTVVSCQLPLPAPAPCNKV